MTYLKCEEGHEVYVECEEVGCHRGADASVCDRHNDKRLDEAKDDENNRVRSTIAKIMKDYEAVTDIDNPLSISDLAKELDNAI